MDSKGATHEQVAGVDTRITGNDTVSMRMGTGRGEADEPASRNSGEGVTVDIGNDEIAGVKTGLGPQPGEETAGLPEGSVEGQAGDETAENDESQKAEAYEPLPAFNPKDQTSVEAYDGRFTVKGADGSVKPNLTAFTTEWENLSEADKQAGKYVTDETAKYLAQKYGLTADDIKEIGDGQMARRASVWGDIFSVAGGADKMPSMLEWAKGGGYNADQQAAYNEAYDAVQANATPKAIAAYKTQVELLASRFGSANPKARPVAPKRDVSAGGQSRPSSPNVQPFATEADYATAWKEVRAKQKAGTATQAELDQVRARLKASPWWRGGHKASR